LRRVREDGLDALAAELRAAPPAGVAALADEHLSHLAAAVASARRRQAAELQAAGDRAMSAIPRLLRGPIRRVVGG
jgi:hypothetical protein